MVDLFPGFARRRVPTSGAEIHLRVGGDGPPVLLLHGYPQTHACWHRIAPPLAERFTVVAPDLRGYGDSGVPPSDSEHRAYSKRVMAQDQVEVMRALGFERFAVVGHDRGARVAYRMALDHPERVARLALDAFVWTGEGSPTLAERRKRLPEFQAKNRRAIDRAFVQSIFARDHPGTADDATIEAFAKAILALDDSVPTGTYVDMCSKLPLVDPQKITVPTLVMRGQWDGIASMEDLVQFFRVQSQARAQQMIRLADELHIAVLDAVVNHLDVMARAVFADPIAARRAVFHLGGDGLKDFLDVGPRRGVSAWHDRRPEARSLFAA